MEHQDLFLEQDILLEVVEQIQRVIQQLVKEQVELVAGLKLEFEYLEDDEDMPREAEQPLAPASD